LVGSFCRSLGKAKFLNYSAPLIPTSKVEYNRSDNKLVDSPALFEGFVENDLR
jgi:hypothetical protein